MSKMSFRGVERLTEQEDNARRKLRWSDCSSRTFETKDRGLAYEFPLARQGCLL